MARFAKPLIALLSTGICLIASEGIVRLSVEPVNFLRPTLVADPVLRWRVRGGSGGHDAWGFRNETVPRRAHIVAVGDSQTYGNGAAASRSWPAWLGRLSGRSVYNLALGGYGPIDYRALVEQKALSLRPRHVVVGFYLGNDAMDSYRSVYAMDAWSRLRDPGWRSASKAPPTSAGLASGPWHSRSPLGATRVWIGQHSVLYQMLSVSMSDRIRAAVFAHSDPSRLEVSLIHDSAGALVTALDPAHRMEGLDLSDARIPEGLRLSLDALGEIDRLCRRAHAELLVLLIPTKIRVFAKEAGKQQVLKDAELISQLVDYEREVTDQTLRWLEEHRISTVQVLDDLRAAIGLEWIYRRDHDGHPTSSGYRIIAEAVARRLGEGS